MNKHTVEDLKNLQSLSLETKIIMTKQRIKEWYESWKKYEIYNIETGKTRFITSSSEPVLKENECIDSVMDGQVYVSFSGGKDSTVLKHIVDSMYDDVPAVFVNTGLEYPEIQKFAMSQPNVITVRPEMRFDEVIKKYGYPVISKEVAQTICEARKSIITGKYSYAMKKLNGERIDKNGNLSRYNIPQYKYLLYTDFAVSHKCCDVMKKNPAKKYEKQTGRKAYIATMASESQIRRQKWLQNGCNAFENGRPISQPLSFWTEQDILRYIKMYNVPYCSVYGDIVVSDKNNEQIDGQMTAFDICNDYDGVLLKTTGCDRTGCIFCMFGCHLEKEPNRFQRLKKTHPRQYEYCIGGGEMVDGKWQPNKDGLGLGYVLDCIGVKY